MWPWNVPIGGVTFLQALPWFVVGWVFGVTSLWRYRPVCSRRHADDLKPWSSGPLTDWTDDTKH